MCQNFIIFIIFLKVGHHLRMSDHRLPLLPLVEVLVNLVRFHTHFNTAVVATQLTGGPVLFGDLALLVAKDATQLLGHTTYKEGSEMTGVKILSFMHYKLYLHE